MTTPVWKRGPVVSVVVRALVRPFLKHDDASHSSVDWETGQLCVTGHLFAEP